MCVCMCGCFLYSFFFFFFWTVNTLSVRLILIHVLVCNMNVCGEKTGVVCVEKDGRVEEEEEEEEEEKMVGGGFSGLKQQQLVGCWAGFHGNVCKKSTGAVPQSRVDALYKRITFLYDYELAPSLPPSLHPSVRLSVNNPSSKTN